MPEIFKKTELVFCDTELELPETYDYLKQGCLGLELFNCLTVQLKKLELEHLLDIFTKYAIIVYITNHYKKRIA